MNFMDLHFGAWIGRYFADDIFKCIFLRDKFCILIQISLSELCSQRSDWQLRSIGSANGFVMGRWQVIAWTNYDPVDWHIYASPGDWFNIKMSSNRYRKSHCGDKTILRPSYLHNGTSYTGKMTSLYWIRAQVSIASTSYLRAAFICNIMFYWAYFIAELYQLSSVYCGCKVA